MIGVHYLDLAACWFHYTAFKSRYKSRYQGSCVLVDGPISGSHFRNGILRQLARLLLRYRDRLNGMCIPFCLDSLELILVCKIPDGIYRRPTLDGRDS